MGASTSRSGGGAAILAAVRRNAWTIGLVVFMALLLVFTKIIQPSYGAAGLQGWGAPFSPWRWPPWGRPSLSSPAASTFRLAP